MVHADRDSARVLAHADAYAAMASRVGVKVGRRSRHLIDAVETMTELDRTDTFEIATELTVCDVVLSDVVTTQDVRKRRGRWEVTVTLTCGRGSLDRAKADRLWRDHQLKEQLAQVVREAGESLAAGDTCRAVEESRRALAIQDEVCFWQDPDGSAGALVQQAETILARHAGHCDALQRTVFVVIESPQVPLRTLQIFCGRLQNVSQWRILRQTGSVVPHPAARVLTIHALDARITHPAADSYRAEWSASLWATLEEAGNARSITAGPISFDSQSAAVALLADEVAAQLDGS